jgi:WD40 repeat protein/transcriptional regulator with XRE-family HTH domain
VRKSPESTPEPLASFCRRLRRLQRESGITQQNLASAVDVSAQTMSDILNGKIRRAPQWERVEAMVKACLTQAAANARSLPEDLANLERWRQRHFDLEQDLEASARVPDSHQVEHVSAVESVLMNDFLRTSRGRVPNVDKTDPKVLGVHPTTPVRRRWMMAGADGRGHFDRFGRGQRNRARDGDLFRGRQKAIAVVRETLSADLAPGRPVVITGMPGAGKSSLLARIVLDSDTNEVASGLAFHAHGAALTDVVTAVASALGVEATGTTDLIDALTAALPDAAIVVVAIDALDEVQTVADRRQITQLLIELAALPQVRVLVATRRLSGGHQYGPNTLLFALGITDAEDQHLVDLDNDKFFHPDELRAFAAAMLTQANASHPGPHDAAWASYRTDAALTDRLAAQVVARAGRNYLVAALASDYLSTLRWVVDPAAPGYDATQIPASVDDAITKYLDALPTRQQTLTRGRLTALAYARGDGVDDATWAAFATALGYPTTQADLDELRTCAAVDYLLHTRSDNTSHTTRLFHQALVDELLRPRVSQVDDEATLLQTLLPDRPRGWTDTTAYARDHAAEHAAAAGRLQHLLHDCHYLTEANLDRLLPLLPTRPSADDAPIIAVLRGANHHARAIPTSRRARLLALTAAHCGLTDLQQRFNAVDDGRFQIEWAHSLGQPHQRIPITDGQVRAIEIGRLDKHGDIMLCAVDDDIHVWDATGQPVIQSLAHPDWVAAVAIGHLRHHGHNGNRGDVIVSGCGDGTIRIWDATGQQIGPPLTGHTKAVLAVAIGRLGNRDVIVSAGHDGTVRKWDATGQQIGPPLTGHTKAVLAVAIGRLGNRDVIVSAGDDGTVRIWDATGHQIGPPLTAHTCRVNAVAIGRLGSQDVIVSGGDDGSVRVWTHEGRPVGTPLTWRANDRGQVIGRSDFVSAVGIAHHPDHGDIIVSGHSDDTICVWSTNMQPIGQPLIGHNSRIHNVVVGRLGERVVVAAADCSKVLIWDSLGQTFSQPLDGHAGGVNSVAIGDLGRQGTTIVSAGVNKTLRAWDTNGHPIAHPLTGHTDYVGSVVVGHLRNQGHVIVSGGGDGEVRMWDADQQPIGQPLNCRANDVSAVAISHLDDRIIAVSSAIDRDNNVDDINEDDVRYDNRVWLWHPRRRPVSRRLRNFRSAAFATAIGRLGDRDVVVCGDYGETVRIWDTTGQPIRQLLIGPNQFVTAVALGHLCNYGDIIATANYEGTVQIWDAHGQPIGQPLLGHTGPVYALAIGQLGNKNVIVSGGRDDTTVRIWDISKPGTVEIINLLTPVYAVELLGNNSICVAADYALCLWTDRTTRSNDQSNSTRHTQPCRQATSLTV